MSLDSNAKRKQCEQIGNIIFFKKKKLNVTWHVDLYLNKKKNCWQNDDGYENC